MTVVIGTAGHIDHGKTTLLRALTGIDADRLPEERRRGMTIEVGYAHLAFDDGTVVDFVDVPGHERLVGNMLVGAGEIDAVLLVVAADDGPRAQTIEHLGLLHALGLTDAVVALTKVDLLDGDPARLDARRAAVRDAVRALVDRTSMAGSPIVEVSGATGAGLDDLWRELLAMVTRVGARLADGRTHPARIAVDRVFGMKGRGTVVTGSLRGGPLAVGDSLEARPGRARLRIRELQVHNGRVRRVDGGGRVALNLAGPGAERLTRGVVLSADPDVVATRTLLARLRPPFVANPGDAWPPKAGGAFRVFVGTEQVGATRGRGRSDASVLDDGSFVATLRLAEPIAAAPGDRLVLRRPMPVGTVAGGIVLDAAPPTGPARKRQTRERVTALAQALDAGQGSGGRPGSPAGPGADAGSGAATDAGSPAAPGAATDAGLPVGSGSPADTGSAVGSGAATAAGSVSAARLDLHGALPAAGGPRWLLARDVAGALTDEALERVAAAPEGVSHAELRGTLVRGLRRQVAMPIDAAGDVAARVIAEVVADHRLMRDGDLVRLPGHAPSGPPPDTLLAMDRLEALLATAAPPPLADAARAARCPDEGIRALEAAGRIVRLEPDLAWAAAAHRALEAQALDLARRSPLSPAALRDATGTSRKYVMTLLEDFDRRGILRRTAAGHVPGPRAPQ